MHEREQETVRHTTVINVQGFLAWRRGAFQIAKTLGEEKKTPGKQRSTPHFEAIVSHNLRSSYTYIIQQASDKFKREWRRG
jgi:hypothetical protein